MTSKSFKTYQEDLLLATYDRLSEVGLETADYLSDICENSDLKIDDAMIFMALANLEKQQLIIFKYAENIKIEDHTIGIRLRGISKAEKIRENRKTVFSKKDSSTYWGKPIDWGKWGAIATILGVVIALTIAVLS